MDAIPTELLQSKNYGPFYAVLVALGAILTIYVQIRSIGNQANRRYRDLEDRTKAVVFWDSWVKAQAGLASPDELARIHAVAKVKLDELAADGQAQHQIEDGLSAFRRFFLLYPPRKPWMWSIRLFYYTAVLAAILLLALSISDVAQAKYSMVTFMTVAVLIFLASLLRTLALVFERSQVGKL